MKQFSVFFIITFLLLSSFIPIAAQTNHWETIFYSDTTFSYYTSTEGSPSSSWRNKDFNDTNWRTGKGGIGYGDNDDNTSIEKCISVCMRTSFNLNEIDKITEAVLNVDYDDAFVAYLNGVEIARSAGLSGDFPGSTQLSTNNHEAKMFAGGLPEVFSISLDKLSPILLEGENVMAIQVHNLTAGSSDMSSNIFFSVGISDSQIRYLSTPNWFTLPFNFNGSNLPLLLISTNGETIVDEPKITAELKIIHTENSDKNYLSDEPNIYNGKIGIERRGASSFNYPQRPYLFETRNEDGSNNNVSILGMPEENDWILLSHYNDKTLMRNSISFDLFREMGHYSVRNRLVDVVINEQYQGIYLLCEKVKRDKNRVDIAKLKPEDNQGDGLTGGYIFKVDYNQGFDGWQSNYSPIDHPNYSTRFVFYYPDYDNILGSQREYLKSHIDEFQFVMNQPDFVSKYNSYINDSSFIDYFLLNELARNVDGYKKSRYFHKDKDSKGSLIEAGPVWDFDWAWKNINDCYIFKQTDGSGWAYNINDCYQTASPGWYVRLLQDPAFANKVNCRYFELRQTILSNDYLNSKIDSIYNLVSSAQIGHFTKWDILGTRTGAPEVESPAQTYDEEVDRLKDWISVRLEWLDNNMVGSSGNCVTSNKELASSEQFTLYPNPASTHINFESDIEIQLVEIFDYSGRIILKNTAQYSKSVHMNLEHLKSGLYLTRTTFINGKSESNKLIIR